MQRSFYFCIWHLRSKGECYKLMEQLRIDCYYLFIKNKEEIISRRKFAYFTLNTLCCIITEYEHSLFFYDQSILKILLIIKTVNNFRTTKRSAAIKAVIYWYCNMDDSLDSSSLCKKTNFTETLWSTCSGHVSSWYFWRNVLIIFFSLNKGIA